MDITVMEIFKGFQLDITGRKYILSQTSFNLRPRDCSIYNDYAMAGTAEGFGFIS
jgi:hypothetical protein